MKLCRLGQPAPEKPGHVDDGYVPSQPGDLPITGLGTQRRRVVAWRDPGEDVPA